MMEKTVELKINPMRVITTILTLAAFGVLIGGAVRWMTKAENAHDSTEKLTTIVDQLNDQQQFERKLWGDSYEKRISDILQQGEDGE